MKDWELLVRRTHAITEAIAGLREDAVKASKPHPADAIEALKALKSAAAELVDAAAISDLSAMTTWLKGRN